MPLYRPFSVSFSNPFASGRGSWRMPFGNPFSASGSLVRTPLSAAYSYSLQRDLANRIWGPKYVPGMFEALQQGEGSAAVSFDKAPDGVKRWADLIQRVSFESGVPADVLAAIMEIESGGNPDAVSPAGAVGLMQVMPQFHSYRAYKYGNGDLRDPYVNVRVAAEILAENYATYGDWDKAAAAYFGAIDAYGNITNASDGISSGYQYVQRFRENREKYRYVPAPSSDVAKPAASVITGGQSYPVTQAYWAQADPSWYPSTGGHHMGIDLAVPLNTPLYAPFAGKVVHAGPMEGYGIAVMIDTGFGYLLLGHLNQANVRVGDMVRVGSQLGLSGNTGFSTGPHLHIEMRDYNGNYIDPNMYLWF
jgi:murein DD-endopeptidase MepM/ murein hydrolase activator NlpD